MAEQLRGIPELEPEIIEAAKAGNLVLFIGAGISKMAGHPSWDGFADAVVNQLVKNEVIDHHEKSLINALPDPRKPGQTGLNYTDVKPTRMFIILCHSFLTIVLK